MVRREKALNETIVWEPFVNALNTHSSSADRAVLAALAFYMGQAARSAYTLKTAPPAEAVVDRSHAFNEMQIIVADELLKTFRGGAARSNEDLISALGHWASKGGCIGELTWALGQALGVSG